MEELRKIGFNQTEITNLMSFQTGIDSDKMDFAQKVAGYLKREILDAESLNLIRLRADENVVLDDSQSQHA